MAGPRRHRKEEAIEPEAADVKAARAKSPAHEEPAPAPAPAAPPPAAVGEATPSMAQFLEIKTANPDSLLWYRMGDFYELFFDDAVAASQALGIVLTKRGKHLGQDIPMCGVPIHRADEYLQRLIRLGYRVAVCEQLEDPAEARKRGSKAVVRRDVVRLVTPGTLTEETLLDARSRNYLTALFRAPGGPDGPLLGSEAVVALASLDISTGEFEVGETRGKDLPGELVRLAPSEVIVADGLIAEAELKAWIARAGAAATPVPVASFDSLAGERDLKARLGVADLGAFGAFTRAELAAVGALLRYVDLTQIGKKPVVRAPRRLGTETTLVIDAASRASLELVRATSGEKVGSLLDAIDRTVTGAGARELAARLATPLTDPRAIEARLDAVAFLVDDEALRDVLRETLKGAPDLARAVSRLAFGRGGPRDLQGIALGLAAAAEAARLLREKTKGVGLPDEIARLFARIDGQGAELLALLSAALVDDPPHLKRDGGFVRRGFRVALDEAIALRDDSRRVMAELEARYVALTGIKTLKVRHNNILGYFIEVTQTNAKPLTEAPLADTFRHRQSMANAMRFTTAELSEIEGRIASAADRALAIEQEIFSELAAAVARDERTLSDIAAALAELDHTAALAHLAHHERFVRPVVDDGLAFEIRGGRHPVVEQALQRARGGPFVANDCVLGRAGPERPPGFDEMPDARIWLVTGPNMAGKSTFLRQNALIAILAQMGSFVPAAQAHIGVVDRLFSRVGAADDLARGRSTFMVEMVETAAILNQATSRSLVILDEIGRGTATFDGLSIAWAAVEYLHEEAKARVLFATHYHELTALAGRLPQVANVTMDVKEWADDIVFLHRVKAGAADRSYGIQVAKLAGLPPPVVARAREVLALLEKADRRRGQGNGPLEDLPLFAAARPTSMPAASGPGPVEVALDAINPDELSPKAALDALYALKKLRTDGSGS
ncbi:DNA mismatch repair protein MutS [Hyphomicrobium sp.]|uniref:DNA mismatch repair protein MutS n=1 Tax=Hyphomicrobium sp. TaxID=82 RepID=UPI0025B8D622|nr:DNA mismatch repair protein MutS [Hyphomicrobium sp.]MCC7253117.1 DNA mismatch repair protein MutS [Hyphomicrobium sp.]